MYVTRKDGVRIVDFNTWSSSTQPLMFTWEELESIGTMTVRCERQEGRGGEIISDVSVCEGEGEEKESNDTHVKSIVRVVTEKGQIRPGMSFMCGAPFDLVDVSEGSALDEFVRKNKDMDNIQSS